MATTITRLRTDWPHLLRTPALIEARAAWAADDARLAAHGLDTLLATAGTATEPSPRRNALLAALADQAQPGRSHARLASRVLLQLLLPSALGLVKELKTVVPDASDREATVLAGLLECIAAIPRPVDPTRVAVAPYLKVSTRRRVSRELQRHGLAALPVPRLPSRRDTVETVDPGYTEPGYAIVEAASWLHTARAAALIDDLDAQLIAATRLHGRPLAQVCVEHRLSHDTARRRRARAELALRAAA